MLYIVHLDARKPGDVSPSEFRRAWDRSVAFTRRLNGVVQGYRSADRQTAYFVAESREDGALEEALAGLPIIEKLGGIVEVTPVLPYDGELDAGEDLRDEEADVHNEPGLPSGSRA